MGERKKVGETIQVTLYQAGLSKNYGFGSATNATKCRKRRPAVENFSRGVASQFFPAK